MEAKCNRTDIALAILDDSTIKKTHIPRIDSNRLLSADSEQKARAEPDSGRDPAIYQLQIPYSRGYKNRAIVRFFFGNFADFNDGIECHLSSL